MAWSRSMHILKRRLGFFPWLQLYAILKPVQNLKTSFRTAAARSLALLDSQHVHNNK